MTNDKKLFSLMAERSASGRLMMGMLPIISILGFAYHVREMIKMDKEIEALRKEASA